MDAIVIVAVNIVSSKKVWMNKKLHKKERKIEK